MIESCVCCCVFLLLLLLWQSKRCDGFYKIEFMNLWFNSFSNSCESLLSRQFPMCTPAKWRWRRRLSSTENAFVCVCARNLLLNANIRDISLILMCIWRWQVCNLSLLTSSIDSIVSCENDEVKKSEKNLLSIFFWIPFNTFPLLW